MRLNSTAIALALSLLAPLPALAQTADAPQEAEQTADAGAYLAARVAGAESDFRSAAGWSTRALLADPGNPALIEGALIANLGLGEFDAATPLAKALAGMGEKSQTAAMALIADDTARGDFTTLLAALEEGRSVGALLDGLVAAWAEAGNGRMSEALVAFDKVATAPGLELFGLYHKALAMASVGDYEGADAILSGEKADEINMLRRGVVAHAQILSQLERNEDAIKLLDAAAPMGGDPGIDALRVRLQGGEAVPFDIARNATDGIAEVFFTMATALTGEAENAYTLLFSRVAAYLRPEHTEAVLLTAGLLDAQRQFDLAVDTFASVAATDPAFHIAEIGRADSLHASGNKDAAIEVLQALSRSHAQIISVHIALGDMLRRDERYEDATLAYDAALNGVTDPGPQHWALFYSRGICHERQKRWPEAEADLRKALELAPDQPQILNYLGYSYIDMNQNLDEALAMIERAVTLQPDSGAILDSLAWGMFRLGRYAEALDPMERASLLEPVDPVVTDHLGDVYWAVGRLREAEFQWRRALSFDPDEAEATRIRRKLEVGLDAVLAEEGAAPLKPVDAAANGN